MNELQISFSTIVIKDYQESGHAVIELPTAHAVNFQLCKKITACVAKNFDYIKKLLSARHSRLGSNFFS